MGNHQSYSIYSNIRSLPDISEIEIDEKKFFLKNEVKKIYNYYKKEHSKVNNEEKEEINKLHDFYFQEYKNIRKNRIQKINLIDSNERLHDKIELIELNFKDKLRQLDENKIKSLEKILNKFSLIKNNMNNFKKDSILQLIKKRTSLNTN